MTFLFWGFTALWIIVVAYVWSLAVRQRKLADELEMFGEVIKEKQQVRTE